VSEFAAASVALTEKLLLPSAIELAVSGALLYV
jgi:hypothetical protein